MRNITSDQYAGCAKDELADPRVYCELLRQYSFLHPEFSYLPRKFKIAITGSPNDRAAVAVHDIGMRMHNNERGEMGFEVLVGGGLGRTPYIGQTIRKWLAPEHLLSYVEAILRVYNMHGRRDNIHKARIKIIVNQLGIDKFRELVDQEWEQMKDGVLKVPDDEIARIAAYFAPPPYEKLADRTAEIAALRKADRTFDRWVRGNVVAHKVPGYAIVNVSLKAPGRVPGDITAETMDAVADLADRYSFGEIRVNHRQNLVLVDVKQSELHELWQQARARSSSRRRTSASSPTSSAARASTIARSRTRARSRSRRTSRTRSTDLDEIQRIGNFTINISGCMNACGHHHVGHIGILGVDKRGEEFFQLTLGGSSDQHASLGDRLGPGFAASRGARRDPQDRRHVFHDARERRALHRHRTGASASSRSRLPSTAPKRRARTDGADQGRQARRGHVRRRERRGRDPAVRPRDREPRTVAGAARRAARARHAARVAPAQRPVARGDRRRRSVTSR